MLLTYFSCDHYTVFQPKIQTNADDAKRHPHSGAIPPLHLAEQVADLPRRTLAAAQRALGIAHHTPGYIGVHCDNTRRGHCHARRNPDHKGCRFHSAHSFQALDKISISSLRGKSDGSFLQSAFLKAAHIRRPRRFSNPQSRLAPQQLLSKGAFGGVHAQTALEWGWPPWVRTNNSVELVTRVSIYETGGRPFGKPPVALLSKFTFRIPFYG